MEEMELIHKVENGELDMLGYVMLNPELKEPFSDYAGAMASPVPQQRMRCVF